jgi:hypothetical protein
MADAQVLETGRATSLRSLSSQTREDQTYRPIVVTESIRFSKTPSDVNIRTQSKNCGWPSNNQKRDPETETEKLTSVSSNQHHLDRQESVSVQVHIARSSLMRTRKLQSHHRVFVDATGGGLDISNAIQCRSCDCRSIRLKMRRAKNLWK